MDGNVIPDIGRLEQATIQLMQTGFSESDVMREKIAGECGLSRSDQAWHKFVNNHAWALVRLQAKGRIRKIDTRRYELTAGQADLTPPIEDGRPLRKWARVMISNATRKNATRWEAAPFHQEDLIQLWKEGGGRCMLTGLQFRETSIGSGKARRPYAPSLDRIDAKEPYTPRNCRLVLQAVNFALNAFGDDVFLLMADGATKFRNTVRSS